MKRSDYEACKNRNRQPLESTCQWLLDHPAYIHWAGTNSNSILQISGGPGAGKSVLSRYVLDDGFQEAQCVKTYFFFKRDGEKEQDEVSAALYAILHQLLIAQPSLLDIVSSKTTTERTVVELSELLLQVIDAWNFGTILCVIDGLDECEEVEKLQILRIIQNIDDRVNASARSSSESLKFLFTSRSQVFVECCVRRKIPTIVLSGQDEAAAINRELQWIICMELDKIATEFGLEEIVQTTLLERLLEVPQPTYSWVVTIFQDIRSALKIGGTNLAILIDGLPRTLGDPYELLIRQVTGRHEAKVIIQCLLVAQRSLSVAELDVILALNPTSTSYENLDRQGEFLREKYIRDICGSFVTVSDGKVYFIHDAARGFLLQITGSKHSAEKTHGEFKELQTAHQVLARACVQLLLFEKFTKDPLSVVCRYNVAEQTEYFILRWTNKNFIHGWMSKLFNEQSQLAGSSSHGKDKKIEKCETDEVSSGKDAAEATAAVRVYRDTHPFLEYAATYWHIHLKNGSFSSDSDFWREVMRLYNLPTFGTWFSVYWATKTVTELPHFTRLTVSMALEQDLMIPILIANGVYIEEEDAFGQRPLHWAACNGSYEMVHLLLQHGAMVDPKDGAKRTPLHLAVLKCKDGLRKIALLLHYGAEINAIDADGLTALHLVGNNAALSQLLIEHGANVEKGDIGARTPLIMAAAGNAVDVARTLLENGAELTSQAMYRAAFAGSLHVINLFDEWRKMLAKQRIAQRSDAAAKARPLLEAARNGHLDDFHHKFRQDRVPLDSCDLDGNNVLHHAAKGNHVNIIRFVLQHGLDPDLSNEETETALHIAAKCGHDDAIRCLLGIDQEEYMKAQDQPESNADELSDQSSQKSREPLLKSYKQANLEAATSVGRTPLFLAAQHGRIDTLKLLLDTGADVNCKECEGANALFLPALESRMEIVRLLIDHGADVNSQEKKHGFTPLFATNFANNIEMARLLLDNGADLDMRAHPQLPVTAHAISLQREEILHLLFEYGADITAVDGNCRSLLHWAVYSNSSEDLIAFLLENGADPHAMDVLENTAADYALQQGSPQAVINLLNSASQNQPMEPQQMFIRSMLKAVDAVQSRLLDESSATDSTMSSANPQAITLTAEDVPLAMSTLLDTANFLRKRKLSDETGAASSSSSQGSFDKDKIWQTLLLLSQALPSKGHEHNPENAELIPSLTHKLGLLLIDHDHEATSSDADVDAASRKEMVTVGENIDADADEPADTGADVGANRDFAEQESAHLHAGTNIDRNIDKNKAGAGADMGIMSDFVLNKINERHELRKARALEWINSGRPFKMDSTDPLSQTMIENTIEDVSMSSQPGSDNGFKELQRAAKEKEAIRIRSFGNDEYFTVAGYPVSVLKTPALDGKVVTKTEGSAIGANVKSAEDTRKAYDLIYKKLPDRTIRVLDLLPGSEMDPISAELRPVSFDNLETYEALSYTWGTSDNKIEIQVNGHPIEAGPNLFAAMTRFRDPTEIRTLWIDALCINQSSIEERTQQVRLMTLIYSKAAKVLVWLGESKNPAALDMLFNVAHERNDYAVTKQAMERPRGSNPVILFSEKLDCLEIVAAVLQQFIQDQDTTEYQPPAWLQMAEAPQMLFIGYKEIPNAPPKAVYIVPPDLQLSQVQRATLQSYETFEEFLIEAAKPAYLELSDREMLQVFDGLHDLLDRPYWSRAWIVQEVIASQDCDLCFAGEKQQINIETLGAVFGRDKRTGIDIKNFLIEDFYLDEASKNLDVMVRLNALRSNGLAFNRMKALFTFSQLTYDRKNHGPAGWTFERFLSSYGGQKATDVRDKVFSVIGLLQLRSNSPDELSWCQSSINYELDAKSVYIEAARYLAHSYKQRGRDDPKVRSAHILDDFYKTRHEVAEFGNLPSWVPNWASEKDRSVAFNMGRIREIDIMIPYDAKSSDESLFLSGHIVDEVLWVSDTIDSGDQNMYHETSLWLKILEDDLGAVYGSEDARFDAFWRTVIADNFEIEKSWSDLTYHYRGHEQAEAWLKHCRENVARLRATWGSRLPDRSRLGPVLDGFDDVHDETHPLVSSAQKRRLKRHNGDITFRIYIPNADKETAQLAAEALSLEVYDSDPGWQSQAKRLELSSRHFVVTRKGYFGLGSPGVQKGDVLALLAGSACPWYLRKQEENQFVISARGWVHGLMYKYDDYYTYEDCKHIERLELR